MLTSLKLSNFKCFDSLSLPLAPLVLLTGFNAAGKSTTLQSLLLLAQAFRFGGRSPELNLNGPLVRLGTSGEVMSSGKGDIIFAIGDEAAEIEWTFQATDRIKGISIHLKSLKIKTSEGIKTFKDIKELEMFLPNGAKEAPRRLVQRLRETIFLSAIRIGISEVFPSPEEASPVHADVGVQGEFAPWWFQRFLDEDIEDSRCHPTDQAKTLRRQFNAWAGQLFPGAQGNAQLIEKTNLVRLELRIGDIGDWRRPSNIGYGLTYAFPVIISGLLAKPKQILIIDSPEAHLHPLGQSQMGQFLAKVAAAGVQVIIETHSDHVINGIRLSVKNKDILPEKVAIHFFNHPDTIPQAISPLIDSQGNLSEWPEGFCDQSEKDYAHLAGWK
jgi:predicted ATPase